MADPIGYALAYSKYKTYKIHGKKNTVPGPKVDIAQRIDIAKKLNEAGISNLREYCTTKKNPVRDFEKAIRIVAHALKYGPDSCVTKFSISRQYADILVKKYAKYAEECIQKKAEANNG